MAAASLADRPWVGPEAATVRRVCGEHLAARVHQPVGVHQHAEVRRRVSIQDDLAGTRNTRSRQVTERCRSGATGISWSDDRDAEWCGGVC